MDDDSGGAARPVPSQADRAALSARLRQRGLQILYAAAFLLPFGLVFGPLIWWESRDGESDDPAAVERTPIAQDVAVSAPASGDWPPGVTFVPYRVPAMIKNEFFTAGEQHGYQFTGQPQTYWRIAAEPQPDSAADPRIALYGPSGSLIAENDDRAVGDPAAELGVTLAEAGAYRLVVAGDETAGKYLLSLFVE